MSSVNCQSPWCAPLNKGQDSQRDSINSDKTAA